MGLEQTVVDWSREGLRMALLLGGPILLTAVLVGMVVGAAQTLTQMQEPIVGQVARLIAVAVVVLAMLPWLIDRFSSYAADQIGSIPRIL